MKSILKKYFLIEIFSIFILFLFSSRIIIAFTDQANKNQSQTTVNQELPANSKIINASDAYRLNQDRQITENIFDNIKQKDNVWTNLNNNEYVRVSFEQSLDKTSDITIYAKSKNLFGAKIEVYEKNSNHLLATFDNISRKKIYKILLTNLSGSQETFDLKIFGNIEIDWIVDPSSTEILRPNANGDYTNISN